MRLIVPGVGSPSESFTFQHDGDDVEAQAGDTVASALINAGRLTCRVAHDGTARGVFCGMGACGECSVVVDGMPGVLACVTKATADMTVEALTRDTGTGLPGRTVDEHRELKPDVLVVGAGPAGLAAAATIAESGADVVVIDERASAGGQFYKQPAAGRHLDLGRLDLQFRAGRDLIDRVNAAGVRMICGTVVWAAFSPSFLVAHGGGVSWNLRPRRLVIATGAQERPVPIPGWTLPGVMMTGAAQTLVRSGQTSPGRRVLVAGNGPLNMQVAAELAKAGVQVVALVERADLRMRTAFAHTVRMGANAPGLVKRGLVYRSVLARARVPIIDRAVVSEMWGGNAVERASVVSVDSGGRLLTGTTREFDVDSVCLGYGFIPATELARSLGCEHVVDAESGDLVPVCSESGRTSIDHVWVVGDSAGIRGAHVAEAIGETAGTDVVTSLGMRGRSSEATRRARSRALKRHERFQRSLWSLYGTRPLSLELTREDTTICRCESVSYGELWQCFESGVVSLGAAKRITRAGMGRCQGRYCQSSILAVQQKVHGLPIDSHSGFAPQAPVRPTEVRHIAGSVAMPTTMEETQDEF